MLRKKGIWVWFRRYKNGEKQRTLIFSCFRKMLEKSFLVIDCFHEMTVFSIWQLSLLVFVRIFNESSWKWIIERRQERLIRRVVFICEAVNLPLLWKQMLKRIQIHTVIKLSVWSNYKTGMCFLHLSGGGGKIEVTVSLIQVGFLPIYDSQDMSVQRKGRLFWFF